VVEGLYTKTCLIWVYYICIFVIIRFSNKLKLKKKGKSLSITPSDRLHVCVNFKVGAEHFDANLKLNL
ncbi:hypothetical protein ACJX0J_015683, partial [Zea mays]